MSCLINHIVQLIQAVFLLELFNPARGVYDPELIAGIEGVTFRTNLDFYVFLGGPDFNLVATGTSGGRFKVIGMALFLYHFHVVSVDLGRYPAIYNNSKCKLRKILYQ